jgi:hypothetical protein
MLLVSLFLAIVFAAFHLIEHDLGFAAVAHDLADDLDAFDERFADPNVSAVRICEHFVAVDEGPRFEREERDVHELVRLYHKLFACKAYDRVHSYTS